MKFLMLVVLSVYTSAALAFPKAPVDDLKFNPQSFLKGFKVSQEDYDFEGIIKLSNCSGSLIKFEGQPITHKAVVMTNGHCVSKGPFGGMLKPGEVMLNKEAPRDMRVFKTKTELSYVKATRILYATMTNTDVAFYELNETFEEIEKRLGVRPFDLVKDRPSEKMPIEIISGYWERGYTCSIDGFVYLLKEDAWTFKDSIRYTASCNTIGGTSGSPIIEKGTRHVVAINNTGNESGERCTMNNPCEVKENGDIFVRKGINYGQQTFSVYSCLDRDFKFDLNKEGCELPKK